MLLRFRCRNFRSIREEQEISLIAAKTRTDEKSESLIDTPFEDIKLLRCVAIYGPNASGKSNVLDALAALRRIVSESWRGWKANGPIPEYDPFLLDEACRTEQTEIEVTFLLESTVFRYRFCFGQASFNDEQLVDSTNRDRVLFRRTTEEGRVKVEFPNSNLGTTREERLQLDRIRIDTRPNSLFLSAAAQYNHPVLSKVYAYLSANFGPVHWKNMSPRQRYTADMCSEAGIREQLVAMMRFADAGISDLEVSRHEMPDKEKSRIRALLTAMKESDPEAYSGVQLDPSTLPSVVEVRMAHSGAGDRTFLLDMSKESDGTQAYFSVLGPLLASFRNGEVLLIDELESSLHPKLVRELVRLFNSPELNQKGAQIIFTTHITNLLDLGLLRRDQIWFTEKTREGATKLYPLTDFQPRPNQNIELGYLGGRFGAVPYLDEQLLHDSLAPENSPQASLQFPSEV
jgi:energy-coupling factor transporter ATP-binding protein EcfA2